LKVRLITLLIIVFAPSSLAQSDTRTLIKDASAVSVTDLKIEERNISHLLAKLAYTFSVPISLEVASNEDLLKGQRLKVQLKKRHAGRCSE
jgi:hypothetical protein